MSGTAAQKYFHISAGIASRPGVITAVMFLLSGRLTREFKRKWLDAAYLSVYVLSLKAARYPVVIEYVTG